MIRKRFSAMLIAAVTVIAAGGATSAAASDLANGTSSGKSPLTITASQSAPTSAAAASCTSGYVCFWVNAGFNDGPGKLSGKNPDWSVRPTFVHSTCRFGTWNDCASSLHNSGMNCNAVLWTEPNYDPNRVGSELILFRGAELADLSQLPGGLNDAISSNSWSAPNGGTNSQCSGPA